MDLNTVQKNVIKYEYTNWQSPNDTKLNRQSIEEAVNDRFFTCPVNGFIDSYARAGNNVYQYHFNERPNNSLWPSWAGVLRGDEIPFIFGAPLNKSLNYDQSEIDLSKQMMKAWANFAKTG